jgi:predicted helicase
MGMKKAKIFYFTLQDEQTKAEKLAWFRQTKFKEIPFNQITPDHKANWINLSDNDFDSLLPLIDKEVKAGRSQEAVFQLFSRGVATQRDEWVYDFSKEALTERMKYFVEVYSDRLENGVRRELDIKWDRELDKYLDRKIAKIFESQKITFGIYRPFVKINLYSDKHLNGMTYQLPNIFPNANHNLAIWIKSGTEMPFFCFGIQHIPDVMSMGGSQCLPLYRYDTKGDRIDNITDWGLDQFQTQCSNLEITKLDIFHYVYAVLHHPAYRTKYELNLKREFPRIPFYKNFQQWAEWGKQLMDLHIHFEEAEPYELERIGEGIIDETHATIQASLLDENSTTQAATSKQITPKCKLKADKVAGTIELDSVTSLRGIPAIAWDYKLGNRSALEWILDQYKEKKPKDPTIAKLFNTYRFADYKEHVIELLQKVCTVSVETMKIIQQMPEAVDSQC